MSADPVATLLATAPGLVAARTTIDSYAQSHRPVLVRGEVTTARAVIPRLAVEGMAPPIEVFCRLGDGDGAIRPALAQQRERLRVPGLLVLLEVGGLGARDHEHMMQIVRHGVIDVSGTPIDRRVVCQLDPRVETLKLLPGVFVEVDLPPLEARPGDALWMFEQLLASQLGGEHQLGADASAAIEEHTWPGDVPESSASSSGSLRARASTRCRRSSMSTTWAFAWSLIGCASARSRPPRAVARCAR